MKWALVGFFVCLFSTASIVAEDSLSLVVIRHGQAWSNVKEMINSNPDHPNYTPMFLTGLGKKQCTQTASELKKQGVNKDTVTLCLVSPLPRAKQTFYRLVKEGVVSLENSLTEPRLIEVQMGDREGLPHSCFPPQDKLDHSNGHTYGGETEADVAALIADLIQDLRKMPVEGYIVLVSHGTPCNELHLLLTGEKKQFQNAEAMTYQISQYNQKE